MRPQTLCKLKKGKPLVSHRGFVDTFNWLVDFCSNLKGYGEIDPGASKIVVDRTQDDYPIIKDTGGEEEETQSGHSVTVYGTDGSSVTLGSGTSIGTITFASEGNSNMIATVGGTAAAVTVRLGVRYK